MDLSHLLTTGELDTSLLTHCGFEKTADGFVCRHILQGTDLYAIYTYRPGLLDVRVYDSFDDEPYALFEDENSCGKFVTGIRYAVLHFAESFIADATIAKTTVKEQTIHLFSERYGVTYDNPWPDDPRNSQNMVFREASGKWVALIMSIPVNRFGLAGEQLVDCINLKHRTDDIEHVIDHKTVFPAYHMNKKHWITVLLTEKTDFDQLISLIEESISLVKRV